MTETIKKIKAWNMRRNGASLRNISDRLNVSKSTASLWCRNIKLTQSQRQLLTLNQIKAGERGRMIGAQMNRRKKEAKIAFYDKQGQEAIKNISDRDFFMLGLALYWGEGSKTDKLSFVNSEPGMIKFMFSWFKKNMKVSNNDFMPRIFINSIHKPRINDVINFWASFLELPKGQFGNPIFLDIKQKKVYKNYNEYYGVLALRIRKSTDIKYRILGLLKAIKRVYND